MKRVVLCAAAAALLAACGGGAEVRELENVKAALEAQRNQAEAIAGHLNEYRREVAALEEEAAKTLGAGRESIRPKAALAAAAGIPGVTVQVQPDGSTLITGPLSVLPQVESLATPVAIQLAVIAGGRFTFTVFAKDPLDVEPASEPTERASAELPPPGRFVVSKTSQKLRAEIVALQQEIAQLDRILGEVRAQSEKKREIEAALARATDSRRAGWVSDAAEALFGAGAPLAEGTLKPAQDAIQFEGAPPRGTTPDAKTCTRIAARLGKSWKMPACAATDIPLGNPVLGTLAAAEGS